MKNYLKLSSKYLNAHKKSSRLAIVSVAISVALVVGMISLLGEMVGFERQNILKTEGNYHILVRNTTEQERAKISGRFEVDKSGLMLELANGSIANQVCALGAIDANIAENMNFHLLQGDFPMKSNEVLLEEWYARQMGLGKSEKILLKLNNGQEKNFIISGIYKDWGETKASSIPIILTSMNEAKSMKCVRSSYFILFKDGVNVAKAETDICKAFSIMSSRIARNEGLLALSLQSKNSRVLQYYVIGVGLFLLVLLTAIVMIYNSLNISVLERMKHFGLLRCIGTSRHQIKKLVRREAFIIALKAIPFGVIIGIIMTSTCLVVLKKFNPAIYGDISLLGVNLFGIISGVVLGFFTVLIACINPANHASRVSPVTALTGNILVKENKKSSKGILSRILPIEITMGIKNAIANKKTFLLMTGSVGMSIVLFLLFQSFINPDLLGARPIQKFTADLKITSKTSIDNNILNKLVKLNGVESINGRMDTLIDASVKKDVLNPLYLKKLNRAILADSAGYTKNEEKSWLISYDDKQLEWANEYLNKGTTEPFTLNEKNGLIAVNKIRRSKIFAQTTAFELGDKVKIQTFSGVKEFEIVGIVDSLPYTTDEVTMTTFVTTEDVYKTISRDNQYKTVDIHLNNKNQDSLINQIKRITDAKILLGDLRQMNEKSNNAYWTVAIFIYGFVIVIAFISVLNIVNTISASVVAKMKRFGVMRAVGMTGGQLTRLVVTEAMTFCILGCMIGIFFGVYLRIQLMGFFQINYQFPLLQIGIIVLSSLLSAFFAAISPIRLIKSTDVTATISAL